MISLSSLSKNCRNIIFKDGTSKIDEWKQKYDLSIPVLEFEYSRSLEEFNLIDEKANKYLLIISIMMTGFFVVISTLTKNIFNFNCKESFLSFILSILFILSLTASIYFGTIVFRYSLRCLELKEIKKMPDILESLKITKYDDSINYYGYILKSYQESINKLDEAIKKKQENIEHVSKNIGFFVIALLTTSIFTVFLKLLG